MRFKKPLLLVPFVLLVIVLVLGVTGLAVAAPATAVKGTWELVYFSDPYGSTMIVDEETGDYVWPNVVETLSLQGDLADELTLKVTFYGNIDGGIYRYDGVGTLPGESDWSCTLKGHGKADPDTGAGWDITKLKYSSPTKGQITLRARFLHNDGRDYAVYYGVLK